MTYPRIIIKDSQGRTVVSCNLDMLILDTDSVRNKIRELYMDNKICSTRHKAVERVLREEFLIYAGENNIIETEQKFNILPEKYQCLLRASQNYATILLTYTTA